MDYRVDEKGKYYTTHVSKQSVAVIARVQDMIIKGTVYVNPESRLKDDLNSGETFIAVTDAEVSHAADAKRLYSADVLILNKDQISWIFPCEPSSPEPAV